MGIKTVAVYSQADAHARHVELAHEAYLLGPAPSKSSYLLADTIIEVAKKSGAQAIHPGYGFLSENESFAKRVEDEGMVFIGPKYQAIRAMGDKIASKNLAQKANVHTIPGHNHAIPSALEAVQIAKNMGYPVMIKASAGGGGKGLRVAYSDHEALEGFTACQNEARNSFGDDRIFIEKFIEEPRHIEIQVLGDAHGHLIYLNERECSIQRRHQKVIEEAPSSFISDATRKAMGEQAVALAKAVQYQSAGTVEFVVGRDQGFYFLEMNTRLQVEHPVTEAITGIDLVEWMIKIAAGERLTIAQSQVKKEGWALECRINAEDPLRQFLPSTGRLVRFEPPQTSMRAAYPDERFGVRVDTGVREGGEISVYYDSMIAKLIVHAPDRLQAIHKMREALNAFVIRGIHTNIPFQAALLAHPQFVSGDFNTGFIAEHFPKGFKSEMVMHSDAGFLIALAAFVQRKTKQRAKGMSGQLSGYDIEHDSEITVVELMGLKEPHYHAVKYSDALDPHAKSEIEVNGKKYVIQSDSNLNDIVIKGTLNGEPFVAQIDRNLSRNPLALEISHAGAKMVCLVLSHRTAELHRLMPIKAPPDMSKYLISPMPGLLTQVHVTTGQKVLAGEKLAVIEAMKMENVLLSFADVVVKSVNATVGESLSVDQIILEFL
jgi:propionyl-CoA carboxylase alpha chain